MAQTPEKYQNIEGEITKVAGPCDAGHKVGDRINLNCWDSGGLCGFFYHDIFPTLSLMQFGGQYPWADKDQMTVECPDRANPVTMIIRRKA